MTYPQNADRSVCRIFINIVISIMSLTTYPKNIILFFVSAHLSSGLIRSFPTTTFLVFSRNCTVKYTSFLSLYTRFRIVSIPFRKEWVQKGGNASIQDSVPAPLKSFFYFAFAIMSR